jgi:hypothetical protein
MRTGSRIAVGAALVLLGVGLSTRSFWRRIARAVLPDVVGSPRDVVAFAPHPSGEGGWNLDRSGNIFAFGNAPDFREVPEPVPWREASFVAIASTPSGRGVWTLDRRGNIYAFGDAPEFREVPTDPHPWREGSPFVAIASTLTGRGVWITDRGGRIYSFGDAAEIPPPRPSRDPA